MTTAITNTIQTPWGMSDNHENMGVGVDWYSTPSHGGYHVDPHIRDDWPAPLRDFIPFNSSHGWYEEDTDFAVLYLAMPYLFNADKCPDPYDIGAAVAKRYATHEYYQDRTDDYANQWREVYKWTQRNTQASDQPTPQKEQQPMSQDQQTAPNYQVQIETRLDKVVSKENGRYAINHALLRIGQAHSHIIATDGKMLSITSVHVDRTESTECDEFIPREMLPTAKKGATLTRNSNWTSTAGKFTPLVSDEDTPTFPDFHYAMPDINQKLPTPEEDPSVEGFSEPAYKTYKTSITIDAKKLLELANAINKQNPDGDILPDAITLFIDQDNKPLIVVGNAGIGALMPISHPPAEQRSQYKRILENARKPESEATTTA